MVFEQTFKTENDMALIVGLIMFSIGLYLFEKKIRKDKIGVSIFNVYWKTKRNGFILVLLLGGLVMFLREVILLINKLIY
jgi:hypothetical protein